MTRIWLKGGFGNILFQMAAGCRGNNDVIFVTNFVERNIVTQALGFKIHEALLLKDKFVYKRESLLKQLFVTLCFFLSSKIKKEVFGCMDEKGNLELFENLSPNSIGYFSSSKSLITDISGILIILSELNKLNDEYSEAYPFVYHFRGTDAWQLEYNKKLLSELFLTHKDNLVVVTDDIDTVIKEGILLENIRNGTVLSDFFMLANTTKKLYLSDSTFAWWASHLLDSTVDVYMPKRLYEQHGYYGNANLNLVE